LKYLLKTYVCVAFVMFSRAVFTQDTFGETSLNYNNSPLNFNNSQLNYNNSPLNYNNSPLNYQNSPLNFNATNGVYDSSGNRIGYETKSPSGVTNYFSNSGDRIGYSPRK